MNNILQKQSAKKYYIFLLILFSVIFSCKEKELKDYAALVDPMIGTNWNGHTFPGATLPFGMVQLSPDTKVGFWDKESGNDYSVGIWDNCSGYHYSDSTIMGFTHTHFSGTGGEGGSDIMFMPTVGELMFTPGDTLNTKTGYRSRFSHDNEYASPGYYSVLLDDYNVRVELTATQRVGLHKYTFPQSNESNVILDLVHGNKDTPDSLFIEIKDNRLLGYRAASGGLDGPKAIYFVAEFSKPFDSFGVAVNDIIKNNLTTAKGKNIKSFFRFSTDKDEPVLLKVAISTVSIDGAIKNMKAELPYWDFEKTKTLARKAWNKELNKIDIKVGTREQQKTFYTALYHASIHPNIYMDVDRKYRSTDNKVYTADKNFDNYTNFSLWDTFRGLHPLQTIINTEKTSQYIKTYIERYEHSLNMPIMEFSGNERYSMIGYHSLPVVADAYAKGIRDYDVEKAYKAMKQLSNASIPGKKYYLQYGFIPYEFEIASVSSTLEYSFDDWCVSVLAKDFNKADYDLYNQRGHFYKNLFNPKYNFMVPKSNKYAWYKNFDPMQSSHHYTEANAYQYSTFAIQDIESLIEMMGGDKAFEKWLDVAFSTKTDFAKMTIADVTGLIGQYAHGNEPSHHVSYLYNYVGSAYKTQKLVRQILTTLYSDKTDGISGNEDAGQMSAWYILSAMGFYSVTPGMDYFVIGSPLFDKVTINLENGKKFTVVANNNSIDNPYIQSVSLNGKPYQKSYLKYEDIMQGSEIVFEMGNKPNFDWGKAKENRPYSLKYNAVVMPQVTFSNKVFLDYSLIKMTTENTTADIRYTLDGTEPDPSSTKYTGPFKVNESSVIKAKTFVPGQVPSYTTTVSVRKTGLEEPQNVSGLKPGIKYLYREGLCAETADLLKYPVKDTGVLRTFNVDAIKDSRVFGYNLTGYINVPENGIYTFYLVSNDGATLYVNDELIVDNDGAHASYVLYGQKGLKKGFHKIKVDYFQMGRAKDLVVSWQKDDGKITEIPAKVLFH